MKKLILTVPLFLVLLLMLAIVLCVCQLWIYGGMALIIALLLNAWSETFPIHHPGNRLKESGSIRILTYNINRAHSISKNKGTTQGLIRFIERQEADVILLQEYNHQLYPEVRERLSSVYPYGLESEGKNDRFKSVFSKYPIEDYEQLWVGVGDSRYELLQHAWYCKSRDGDREVLPVCSMVVKVGDKRLRIVNCHLMSNNYSVAIRNVRKKGRSLIHAILPIMARMDYGYAVRKLQAEAICQHLAGCKEAAVVVCGDFNDISGSTTLRTILKTGLKNAWWQKGCGFGFTFHGMKLRLRLDHSLYSPKGLNLAKTYVPHSCTSDHDPLICDFILN